MHGKNILLILSIVSLFSAILVGAYVTVAGYGDACGSQIPSDWPGCLGGPFPPFQIGPVMEYLHRLFAALSTLFLLVTTVVFWRAKDATQRVKRTLLLATFLLIAQVLLGGAVIAQTEEAILVAAHQGLAILTFGASVAAFAWTRSP